VIPVDMLGEMLTAWSNQVAASRARQGLPPLTGEGGRIEIGEEAIAVELDAPRLIIVPTGLSNFKNEQRMPLSPTHTMSDNQPKVLWSAHLGFTAYCWGDEWPGGTPTPIWWDFNTSLELFRELAGALYRTCTGPSVDLGAPRFEQPTHLARRGRWLVADFAIKIPILDEPYVMLQYGAHPKVEIDLTVETQNHEPDPPTPIVIPS
jgi:hypothetical protein